MNKHRVSNYITGSSLLLPLLIVAANIAAAPAASAAPVVSQLHSFTGAPLTNTSLIVVGEDKFLYGCRRYFNGSEGTAVVYRFAVGGATKTLATFPGAVFSDIINASDGNIILSEYDTGTTGGAILEIGSSGAVTTLDSFTNFTNGQPVYPTSILLGSDGNYYGTSEGGGVNNRGTIFEMNPNAPYTITVLHSFGSGDGDAPTSLFQAADGSFYGTTLRKQNGRGVGLIFKVVAGYDTKTLHACTGQSDGNPSGLMQAQDGTIYGVTYGAQGYPGTIFTLGTDDHYSLVYTFSGTDGANPLGIIQSQRTGNLYGYTVAGGTYSDGTFYQLNPPLNTITTVYSFDEPGPTNPDAMVLHPNGKFYGLSTMGGANDDGAFFSLALSGTTLALEDEFDGGSL